MKNTVRILLLLIVLSSCQEDAVLPASETKQGLQPEILTRMPNSPGLLAGILSLTPEELYILDGNDLYAIDNNTGNGYVFPQYLPLVNGVAATSNYLYLVQGSTLWRAYPTNGSMASVGFDDWTGSEAIAASQGYVYVVQAGQLWKVNPTSLSSPTVTPLGTGSWVGVPAMTAMGSYVYAIDDDLLWKVHTGTGAITTLGTGTWEGTEAMTASGNYVYAVQAGVLWKVHITTGAISTMSGAWAGTRAMTAKDGYVYAIQDNAIWKVNTGTGAISQIGSAGWTNTKTMAALPGY